MNAWLVRAGDDNFLIDVFNEKSAVAIGWHALGDLSDIKKRDELRSKYLEVYGESKSMSNGIGMVYRFYNEISIGDYILTYNKSRREYSMGTVISDTIYDPTFLHEDYPHTIRVEWKKKFSRDELSVSAKNSFGSVLSVFQLNRFIPELEAILDDKKTDTIEESIIEDEIPLYDEVVGKAEERIADMVSSLDGYEFQDLFAAILRAMGFKAKSTPPGRDKGIDIVAHPDEFGFENPVIKVQVKHRVKTSIGGPDMRNFMSALDNQDNGIYVSTGGFTSDAKIEANRYGARIKLMDRDDVIDLLLRNYEKLEPEFKRQIPLKMLWLPYSN